MKEGKREEAEEVKKQVTANAETVDRLSAEEKEVEEKIKKIMMTIPNIIDPSVRLEKMTAKMWKYRDMVNRLFRTLKFHIMQKLWKNSMVLI